MNTTALLICPTDTWSSPFLARHAPPALTPLLGRSALDRAMTRLFSAGARRVLVLAADRPDEIRTAVQGGAPWGLHAEVLTQVRDLTPAEACAKYQDQATHWLPQSDDEMYANVWQHLEDEPSWPQPAQWFTRLIAHLDDCGRDTVTMREVQPSVWVSTQARVSLEAHLHAPCWVGPHASILPGASIGPHAIVEARAYIDSHAEIINSHVGPSTYVGSGLTLRDSMVWGRGLLNWVNDSFVEVRDGLLLDDLSQRSHIRRGYWFGRLAAGFALLLTWPIVLIAYLSSRLKGTPFLHTQRAVYAPITGDIAHAESIDWHQFHSLTGWLQRWPELVQVWRGQFTWLGNRPLTPEQASHLSDGTDRLWLAVAPGLFSFGESLGCDDLHSTEARAHAAYHSATSSPGQDLRALSRIARRLLVAPLRESALTFVPSPQAQPLPQAR